MPRQKFWQTQKFKELQKEWEEKLKESGFKDAEDKGRRIIQKASNCYRTQIPEAILAKQRYYELLGHWVHNEIFKDPVERFVMERKAESWTHKQIIKVLRKCGEKGSTETIRKIVRHYEKKWQIKRQR